MADDVPTLASLLDRGDRLATADVFAMLRDVAKALGALHARGVVYGALTPSMIVSNGRGQWALAPLLADRSGRGHPLAYLAPEQRHGGAIDGHADQYALALIAYEVLSGRRRVDAADSASRLALVNEVDLVPGRRMRPDIAPGANDVLREALARGPQQRFPSVEEFVAALEKEHVAALRPPDERSKGRGQAARPAVVISVMMGLLASAGGLTLALSQNAREGLRNQATIVRADLSRWLGSDEAEEHGESRVRRALSQTSGRPAGSPSSGGGSGGRSSSGSSGGGTSGSSGTRVGATGSGGSAGSTPASTSGASTAAADPADTTQAADGRGYVSVTAPGGFALVLVDGIPRGTAPAIVAASAGQHSVRVVGTGRFTRSELELDVTAGDTALAVFEREP